MLEVKTFHALLASVCLGQAPRSLAAGGRQVGGGSWILRCCWDLAGGLVWRYQFVFSASRRQLGCPQAGVQAEQAPSQVFLYLKTFNSFGLILSHLTWFSSRLDVSLLSLSSFHSFCCFWVNFPLVFLRHPFPVWLISSFYTVVYLLKITQHGSSLHCSQR